MKTYPWYALVFFLSLTSAPAIANNNEKLEELLPPGSCVEGIDPEDLCQDTGEFLMSWYTTCEFGADIRLADGTVVMKTYWTRAGHSYGECDNACRFLTLGLGAVIEAASSSEEVADKAKAGITRKRRAIERQLCKNPG